MTTIPDDIMRQAREAWEAITSVEDDRERPAVDTIARAILSATAPIRECEMYLKEGETPRQRMDRDHAENLSLIRLLANEKASREEAIAHAIMAERERAEKVAESFAAPKGVPQIDYDIACTDIANAIRKGTKP